MVFRGLREHEFLMPVNIQTKGVIRFGEFELDYSGELRSGGRKIKLQDQPLQILRILMEQPGEIVTREELRNKVWPSDTFVDFDHGINNAIKRLREVLGDTAETPRFIETLPRRGYRFIEKIQSPDERVRSLAVLPLEDLAHDPEQEYFAEGMTEALIAALAKISALRVTSRTTVICYKGKRQPLPLIARELGVDQIIEGSVLRSGGRVRISVQLIQAVTDSHLWAETYERNLSDVLTLQSEVARAIAKEIQVRLTPQEQALLSKPREIHPDAYEAYLKGRYHWNRRSGEGLERANHYFQQAVAKDSNYAAAYAGLADCANIAGWYNLVSPEEGTGKGKALAQKALAIDDSPSEAHCSLAWALLFYDFDFLSAEREFSVAVEHNPQNATAAEWHAVCLAMVGRFDQSLAEILRAVRLDPLSAIIPSVAGMLYLFWRRYDEGIEICRKAFELDPGFSVARWVRAACLVEQREYDLAIAEMEEVVRITDRAPLHLYMLGHCYGRAGRREQADRILRELEELASQRYIAACFSAIIYGDLNENNEAFRFLEAAYRRREPWMVLSKYLAWFDPLRSDPRFGDLLRRMNFPE
ncbi:MAG: winged helix-turn-helix domain-containing protein [Terriglobales bacterium]